MKYSINLGKRKYLTYNVNQNKVKTIEILKEIVSKGV